MFNNILIPVDGSEDAVRAWDCAIALAQALGSHLLLMSVVEQKTGAVHGAVYQAEDNPMHNAAREAARFWLRQALQRAIVQGVTADAAMALSASVAEGILDTPQTRRADLIVLGRPDAGTLGAALIRAANAAGAGARQHSNFAGAMSRHSVRISTALS